MPARNLGVKSELQSEVYLILITLILMNMYIKAARFWFQYSLKNQNLCASSTCGTTVLGSGHRTIRLRCVVMSSVKGCSYWAQKCESYGRCAKSWTVPDRRIDVWANQTHKSASLTGLDSPLFGGTTISFLDCSDTNRVCLGLPASSSVAIE